MEIFLKTDLCLLNPACSQLPHSSLTLIKEKSHGVFIVCLSEQELWVPGKNMSSYFRIMPFYTNWWMFIIERHRNLKQFLGVWGAAMAIFSQSYLLGGFFFSNDLHQKSWLTGLADHWKDLKIWCCSDFAVLGIS